MIKLNNGQRDFNAKVQRVSKYHYSTCCSIKAKYHYRSLLRHRRRLLEYCRTSSFHTCAYKQQIVTYLWSDQQGPVFVLTDGEANSLSNILHRDWEVSWKKNRWVLAWKLMENSTQSSYRKTEELIYEEAKGEWLLWHSRSNSKGAWSIYMDTLHTVREERDKRLRNMVWTRANADKIAGKKFKIQVRYLFLTIKVVGFWNSIVQGIS